MKKKLTPKQLLFCKEYLKSLNATQSAIKAGYSEKTAYSIGQENLNKPEIAEYIAKHSEKRAKKLEIDAEEVLRVIHETMMESKLEGDKTNTYKGAELLGKHLSLFKEKIEHDGEITLNINKNIHNADD